MIAHILLTALAGLLGFAYGETLDVVQTVQNRGLGIPPHPLDYVFGCYGMAVLAAAIAACFIW